jgi:hypothetical protein
LSCLDGALGLQLVLKSGGHGDLWRIVLRAWSGCFKTSTGGRKGKKQEQVGKSDCDFVYGQGKRRYSLDSAV